MISQRCCKSLPATPVERHLPLFWDLLGCLRELNNKLAQLIVWSTIVSGISELANPKEMFLRYTWKSIAVCCAQYCFSFLSLSSNQREIHGLDGVSHTRFDRCPNCTCKLTGRRMYQIAVSIQCGVTVCMLQQCSQCVGLCAYSICVPEAGKMTQYWPKCWWQDCLGSAGFTPDPVTGNLVCLQAGRWCLESWVFKKGWVGKKSMEGVSREEDTALQCPVRSTKMVT